MYLKFSNKGEVDPQAFTLLGASTKRDEAGKIGMFGSGNKYALAYFLRNDYEVKIYSGKDEIKIGRKPVLFIHDTFNVMTVNGKETSITDQSGPDWILWHAIREIYSNALDEGVIDFKLTEDIDYSEGITSIYITAKPEVLEFMKNIKFFFSFDTNFMFKSSTGKILEKNGETLNLFRRGIRCYDTEKNSIFDYDIKNIEINESRVIKYDSMSKSAVWKLLIECDNVVLVREFLEKIKDETLFEHNDYLNHWKEHEANFSEAWDEVLTDKYVADVDFSGYIPDQYRPHTFIVPTCLYKAIIKKYGRGKSAIDIKEGEAPFREVEQTPFILNSVKKVEEFFAECNFPIKHEIRAVEFLNSKSTFGKKTYFHFDLSSYLIDVSTFDDGLHALAYGVILAKAKRSASETRETNLLRELAKDFLNYMKHQNAINL